MALSDSRKNFALLVAPIVLTLTSCAGQRLLTFEVEQDGKLLMSGMLGVNDSTKVPAMWQFLDDVQFEVPADDTLLPLEEEESVELEDAIVIRIHHGADELASTNLKKLKLKRIDGSKNWQLAKGEGERIRKLVD